MDKRYGITVGFGDATKVTELSAALPGSEVVVLGDAILVGGTLRTDADFENLRAVVGEENYNAARIKADGQSVDIAITM